MADTRRRRKNRKEERQAAYEGETLDARITRVSEEKRQQRQEDVKSDVIEVPAELVEQMMLAVPPGDMDKFTVNKRMLEIIASQSFIKHYFRKWEIIECDDDTDDLGCWLSNPEMWENSPLYMIYLFYKLGVHKREGIIPAGATWYSDQGFHIRLATRGIARMFRRGDTVMAKLAIKYLVNSEYIELDVIKRLRRDDYVRTLKYYLLIRAVITLSPQFHAEMVQLLGEGDQVWIRRNTLRILRNMDVRGVLDPDEREDNITKEIELYFYNTPHYYYDFVDYIFERDLIDPLPDIDITVQRTAAGCEIHRIWRDYAYIEDLDGLDSQLINAHHYLLMARLHAGGNVLTDEQRNLLVWHPEFRGWPEEVPLIPHSLKDAWDAYQNRLIEADEIFLAMKFPGDDWYARHPQ